MSRSGRVKWRVRQSTQHLRKQSLLGTTTQRKRYLSILTVCSNALKAVSVVTTVCPVGPLSACLSVWLRWFDGLLWLVCVRALTLAPIQLIAKH